MAKKSSRKKSIRSKCLKTCPRAIRVKCREVTKNGASMGKVCRVTVKGLVKKAGLSGQAAGKLIGSLKRQLKAKNCSDPRVFSN